MEMNLAKQLVITSVRRQARDIKSFDLSLAEPGEISFLPGQVAILKVPNESPAYFAFASAPDDAELEVLVKQKVGVSNLIFEMKTGGRIELKEVAGQGYGLVALLLPRLLQRCRDPGQFLLCRVALPASSLEIARKRDSSFAL